MWFLSTQLETETERQAWTTRMFAPPPEELAAIAQQAAQDGGTGYEQALAARPRSGVRSRRT